MDNNLFSYINKKEIVPFNPQVIEGLSVEYMQRVEEYLCACINMLVRDFPQGLKYEGYSVATPEETYREITRRKNNKQQYEIATTDTYMIKLQFSFNGHMFYPHCLFLPFVRKGGLMYIRGALFAVNVVLADRSISVAGPNSLFIPIFKDKITFERLVQNIVVNGQRDSIYVVWSKIYKRSKKSLRTQGKPTMRVNSTLAHYLFAKYGVYNTFRKYGNVEVVVGYEDTINEKNYPTDKWNICWSTKIKPAGLGRQHIYTGSDIRLAIKKTDWNPITSGLIGGFFHGVDHFPDRIQPEYLGSEHELHLWRVLLGHVIFASVVSEGKLYEDIRPHMESLDSYMDANTQRILAEDGIFVHDFYDFMAHIIESFSDRILKSSDSVASMYHKRLTLLRYIMSPITTALNTWVFALKHNKFVPTAESIADKLQKIVKTELILSINHEHGEVRPISSSSDNMAFNITTALVMQTNSSGISRSTAKDSLTDPSRYLDASIAEVGQYAVVQKSEPSGRGRINPTFKPDAQGNTIPDPACAELLNSVQEKIRR
jgi:hypothetical protein